MIHLKFASLGYSLAVVPTVSGEYVHFCRIQTFDTSGHVVHTTPCMPVGGDEVRVAHGDLKMCPAETF